MTKDDELGHKLQDLELSVKKRVRKEGIKHVRRKKTINTIKQAVRNDRNLLAKNMASAAMKLSVCNPHSGFACNEDYSIAAPDFSFASSSVSFLIILSLSFSC